MILSPGRSEIISFTCGMNHSAILFEDGSVILFGDNQFMQCSLMSDKIVSIFKKLRLAYFIEHSNEKPIRVFASANSTLLFTDKSTCICMGKIAGESTIKVIKLCENCNLNNIKISLSDRKIVFWYYDENEREIFDGDDKKYNKSLWIIKEIKTSNENLSSNHSNNNSSMNNNSTERSETSKKREAVQSIGTLDDAIQPRNSLFEHSFDELISYINFVSPMESKEKQIELKLKRQSELAEKWKKELIPKWNDIKNFHSTKLLFYEGLPPSLRGCIWLLCMGNAFSITKQYYSIISKCGKELIVKYSNRNSTISHPSLSKEKSILYIDPDIEHTVSFFKSFQIPKDDLKEILISFVTTRRDIGYISGLSFIGGVLLLCMDKFRAFIILTNIVLHPAIFPFYTSNQKDINARLQLFKQIFYFNLPELCNHFEAVGVLPQYYFLEWNMTLYTKCVCLDIVLRILDVFMIEGARAIYAAGIAILEKFEKKFLQIEYTEIMKEIKGFNDVKFDEDEIIHSMRKVKFQDWVGLEIEKMEEDNIPL